jgi:FSR family fosmidomycin resistance protein-like MFS transporter
MQATFVSACDADAQQARGFPFIFGLIHAIVDASTVALIFSASNASVYGFTWEQSFYLVIAYDLLAFAGQAPIGLLVDSLRLYRGTALAGIGIAIISLLSFRIEPLVALVLAGIGNAAFHVGAGGLSLHVCRGRAAPPGIFVAPGALGL